VLPTALTIWLLVIAYTFVDTKIAQPINQGLRLLVLHTSPLPKVSIEQMSAYDETVRIGRTGDKDERARYNAYESSEFSEDWLRLETRRDELNQWWDRWHVGLDLIGLVVAVVLIYFAGLMLTSFIGGRLVAKGEDLIDRVPIVRRVYPSVKQITDFFFGPKQSQLQFSRVVAVEYPRKGLWSVGLVTGETMRTIQDQAGTECLTVFVPSSPTPFTGYVITTPRSEAIDLPITIEEALKFAISGGVLIPPNQQITPVEMIDTTSIDPQVKTPDSSEPADA